MSDPGYYFIRMAEQARYATETQRELALRARIENDGIANLMDGLECPGGCGWPVAKCRCVELANVFPDAIAPVERERDEDLPFADPREVGE